MEILELKPFYYEERWKTRIEIPRNLYVFLPKLLFLFDINNRVA